MKEVDGSSTKCHTDLPLPSEEVVEGGRVIHCAMRVEGNALLRNFIFSERVAVPPIGIEPMTL
jgi:hypothetical protein